MSAASRPDESISGDAGKKKKKEEEGEEKKKKMKKKELIGKWCPAEQTHLFGGEAAGKPRNLLCNLFHCCAIQNILELLQTRKRVATHEVRLQIADTLVLKHVTGSKQSDNNDYRRVILKKNTLQ